MELAARLGGRGGLSAASIERNRQQSVIAAGEAQRAQKGLVLQLQESKRVSWIE